jgi:tetratricopeptide (TPR) repeat protein
MTFLSAARPDKSFNIGLGFLIVFAAVEISVASFHYLSQMHPTRTTAVRAPAPLPSAAPAAAPSAPPVKLAVASPVPMPPVAPAISAAMPATTSATSDADRLLKEAAALRQRGDTTTALARLQEATDKDPKNAQVLAEMATTYESMQNFDRSTATWRRILEMGPSAGPAYALADTKLKSGVAASTSASGPGVAGVSPLDTANSRASIDGIPTGATFGISEVTASETPDPDADTNLMVRIAVKKRPGVVIDHTRVKIQVFFYDTAGDEIKLTDADVSYEWLTPSHDWTSTNSETLAVTYIRPKNKTASSESALAAAAAAINPAKKGKAVKPTATPEPSLRKYLGYIVRVYYNDQLQDKRAQPSKLLTLFPAPNTAPPQ